MFHAQNNNLVVCYKKLPKYSVIVSMSLQLKGPTRIPCDRCNTHTLHFDLTRDVQSALNAYWVTKTCAGQHPLHFCICREARAMRLPVSS